MDPNIARTHVKKLAFPFLLGVTAFYLSHVYAIRVKAAGAPSQTGPPVTFTSVKKMYSDTGQLSESKTRLYSRFRDGSIVNGYTQTFPQQKPLITEMMNVSAGNWVFLDAVTRSTTTLKKTPEEIAQALFNLESEGCPDKVDLNKLPEAETIAGVKTVYYVTHSDGDKVERWMAVDLACLNMREVQTSSGHHGAHNEEEVVSIQRGDPPKESLEPPPLYLERDPKEVERLHIAATGGDPFWGSVFLRAVSHSYSK